MANIVGPCGSLRRGSFNAALLRAAAGLALDGSRIDARTLHGVPLYDSDLEAAEGIPPAMATLPVEMVTLSTPVEAPTAGCSLK